MRTVWKITPRAGSISRLTRLTEHLPDPLDHELTIQVKAIGLNFADIFAMQGLYSATPKGEFIPGLEFSGEVEKVGNNVQDFREGDRVMGVTRFGAYATHLNIDGHYVRKLPENWTFAEGAGFTVQALTAHYALVELGNLKPGQLVLVQSAAGGVGIYANRIAKKLGAKTIGAVGSEKKIELLAQEGYDYTLVRNSDFRNRLADLLNNKELHLVLECIGGDVFKSCFEAMAPMGRIVVYGAAHYATPGQRPNYLKLVSKYLKRPKVDPQQLIHLNKSVMGFNLIWLYDRIEIMSEMLEKLQSLDLAPPLIGNTFDFQDIKDAIALFQSGKTVGKVVVKV